MDKGEEIDEAEAFYRINNNGTTGRVPVYSTNELFKRSCELSNRLNEEIIRRNKRRRQV